MVDTNVEMCIVNMPKRSEGATGTISIPRGVLDTVQAPCKFVAIRKDGSDFIKLLPVDVDMFVFSVFAEVTYGALSIFIKTLGEIAREDDDIKFVPELAAPCPGMDGTPCRFEGIVLAVGPDKIDDLKERLIGIEKDGEKIVHDISINSFG